MFTLDLLKKQGIPIKIGPKWLSVTIIAITCTIPAVIAMAMLGGYLSNSIDMSIKKQKIATYEEKIKEFSAAIEMQKTIENKMSILKNSLTEANSSLVRHAQWSGILVTIAENMPTSAILTNLEASQNWVKRQVPQKDGLTTNMVDIDVPVRTLHISLTGSQKSNLDKEVNDFRMRLLSSKVLGPRLDNITVSQEAKKINNVTTISYEIFCLFKPGK